MYDITHHGAKSTSAECALERRDRFTAFNGKSSTYIQQRLLSLITVYPQDLQEKPSSHDVTLHSALRVSRQTPRHELVSQMERYYYELQLARLELIRAETWLEAAEKKYHLISSAIANL